MNTEHLKNQEAQDYLALKLALEELKLEYKEMRNKNGNAGMPSTNSQELEMKRVILYTEYEVEEAMWTWLETCP